MRQGILCIMLILGASPPVVHQVGDTVVVIAEKEAELQIDDRVVETVPRGTHLTVERVDGDRLWVRSYRTHGYIQKRHVLSVDDALEFFSRAINRSPNAYDYNCRAGIWAAKEKYGAAIQDYNEAIRLDPTYEFAYNNRGIAWARQGEYDKAIADFSEAIRLNPKYEFAHSNRGAAWSKKGEFARAIADFKEAIRLYPEHVRAYNALAWCYATCPDARYRDGRKAVEYANKACELTNWGSGEWMDTLAAAYAEAGDFDAAVKWQQKALAIIADRYKPECRARLELYKSRKPYREKPKD